MKITSVKATCHRFPVTDPVLDWTTHGSTVFTRVETDEGIVGYSTGGGGPLVRDFVNRDVGPKVVGENPLETEKIWYKLYRIMNARFTTGAWSHGVSAVDIALWDIKGKYFGQPIYRLLGGSRKTIPIYWTCGSGGPYEDYTPEQLVEFIMGFVRDGHDKFKFQVARGRHPFPYRRGSKRVLTEARDVARVKAVREAVGDEVQISVDASATRNFPEAIRLCKLFEPFDITWFEEPLSMNDPILLSQLRALTFIPISGGQRGGHKWRHRDLIVNGAVDIVQPNIGGVGGFTEAMKVAHLAQAFNMPIITSGPGGGYHLAAGVDNGWRTEYHYRGWTMSKMIWENPPQPERGWITVPDRPGLGLKPNEDGLAEHLVGEKTELPVSSSGY